MCVAPKVHAYTACFLWFESLLGWDFSAFKSFIPGKIWDQKERKLGITLAM